MKRWARAVVVVLALVATLPGTSGAGAISARLDYHVSDAFLSELTGVPQTGARAETSDGMHLIRFSGSGSFTAASDVATGGGVWAHSSGENGDLFAFGTWTATRVESFESFGCGGSNVPSTWCGGVVELAVHLSGVHVSIGPEEVDGVLTIVVATGPEAPFGAKDVVTFTPRGVPIDFDTGMADPAAVTLFVSKAAA